MAGHDTGAAPEAAFLGQVLNAVSDPVFVKDQQHRWLFVNEAFCRLMGHPAHELLGKSDYDYFPDAEARVFWEMDDLVFASGGDNINEETLTDADGNCHIISTKKRAFGLPDGRRVLVGVIRDITQLRLAEQTLQRHQIDLQELVSERTAELTASNEALILEMEERQKAHQEKEDIARVLRHKQRLDEMGQLAGGVAHDFNNLLTVILGNLSYLRAQPSDNVAAGAAQEAYQAAMKAANLSRQLLAFSRRQPLIRGSLDVSRMVARMERMMSRVVGEHIVLSIDVADSNQAISGDETMIEQVFLNLLINARDALDAGGTIWVKAKDILLAEKYEDLEPGEYVQLTVRDNGVGMDSAVLERVFEPFFTTKPMGRGTGLGLSTVHGIVQQHGGRIEITSIVGMGTCSTVWLPVSHDAPVSRTLSAPSPMGKETVLIVEDEPLVARVAQRMLTDHGYKVLTALSAAEALHLAADYEDPIELTVTDVRMPGMNGVQLARRLLDRRPAMKVLYTTGYSADVFGDEAPEQPVLSKPYTRQSLTAAVRAVLDGKPVCPDLGEMPA